VLIEDGKVARVGVASDGVAEGALTIDLAGKTLMPGIVNAHVHAVAAAPPAKMGAEPQLEGMHRHFLAAQLRESLRMGVTTVRDMGTFGDVVFEARQAMRYGAFRGARILTCGLIISSTAPGGLSFGGMYREVDGPDDVRRGVREQIRRGADFIKVMATGARSVELEAGIALDPDSSAASLPLQLTFEEMTVACEEAKRMGYDVVAHAEGIDGCEAAIELGMRTVDHGMYLHRRPDLLERMTERDVILVPTFSSSYWNASRDDEVGTEAERSEVRWTQELDALAHRNIEEYALTVLAAHRLGTPIGLGADGWRNRGGAWIEILRLIHHGLPARAALVAATSTAARAVGLDELVGTVAPGKLADLLVVDGDPLEHPELLGDANSIWLVLQSGHVAAGAALQVTAADLAGR
jgi:imidazolonepropionase-like amidohydrolase